MKWMPFGGLEPCELDDPAVREAIAELQGVIDSAGDIICTGGSLKEEIEAATQNVRRALEAFEHRAIVN
jgi:hypothetical protein